MNPVLIFRWIVFLLAAFYCVRTAIFSEYQYLGGPFRYLTIWALFLSFFCASRMIALMEGRSERHWDALVSTTAVINIMVVVLYWRLYFADPTSVTSDGALGAWWLEMYLHALGPALQVIDAVFVHRAFRKPLAGLGLFAGVICIYVAWAELVLQQFNDSPVGTVTSGLPYPFLNNLELDGRAVFYATNLAVGIAVFGICAGLSLAARRILARRA